MAGMGHSSLRAAEFLARFRPEGPHVLTSIVPDGKTTTQTFAANEKRDMVEWIEDRQGIENIYFMVNPSIRALSNKASKEEVARLAWLHVDIDARVRDPNDPRSVQDFLSEERERALNLLSNYTPAPTVILSSGGGAQGFWCLNRSPKLEINGVIEKAEELEAYNQQLEKVFGADHCFNCDRIMRLPGTINLPTARKAKKGRVPALASVVSFSDDVYDIEQFTAAVRVQGKSAAGELAGGRSRLKITGNVADIGVEELRNWSRENSKQVSDHVCALIATGADPVDPTKYPSRSEALFRVVCDLIRSEVPDEMIYAVITGSNEIAASVRDKPNWESYALRQIERGHEDAIDPALRELNEQHAVIADMGGKCRIISETFDQAMERPRISKQSFEDFRNRYCNRFVTVGKDQQGMPVEAPLGAWWIKHKMRRQYRTIVFAPGKEVEGAYNLWRGFMFDAIPGDRHHSFLDHVRDNVCSGNAEHYAYLLGWMARLIQHPGEQGHAAIVLRGKRGTGKSFFATKLGDLFGRHFLQVSNSKHLVGSFNAHLRDTVLLFGDEAFYAGDKSHESTLKTLVTEEHLIIEGKGLDAEAANNYTHLILASNEDWVVPAGLDERRFFVLEVGDGKKQDHGYFKRIQGDLDAGGYESLLHYLLTFDLSAFEVRKVPNTAALTDQKARSLKGLNAYLFDLLVTGTWPPQPKKYTGQKAGGKPALFVPSVALVEAAQLWLRNRPGFQSVEFKDVKASMAKFGAVWHRLPKGGDVGYLWNIEVLRASWDKAVFPVSWDAVPDDYYDPPNPSRYGNGPQSHDDNEAPF